ncbi:hypothetical protein P170DRAFT_432267 [Aspergillus steynii IBT 23096]|uniref:Uncharacterized protein n=1 Tax=Aspergillus steynii IBT 23096 TaxID=1392250 RepID=A0A2I2GP35_9EURO|nr:uncharacterized protein P170DRAFT_432267 [Aspergillus steynii IBT 23096]PLB54636.1 hypothetical protein P170DRAFT_432267 [Aspergillus steynii IBT 23096]
MATSAISMATLEFGWSVTEMALVSARDWTGNWEPTVSARRSGCSTPYGGHGEQPLAGTGRYAREWIKLCWSHDRDWAHCSLGGLALKLNANLESGLIWPHRPAGLEPGNRGICSL